MAPDSNNVGGSATDVIDIEGSELQALKDRIAVLEKLENAQTEKNEILEKNNKDLADKLAEYEKGNMPKTKEVTDLVKEIDDQAKKIAAYEKMEPVHKRNFERLQDALALAKLGANIRARYYMWKHPGEDQDQSVLDKGNEAAHGGTAFEDAVWIKMYGLGAQVKDDFVHMYSYTAGIVYQLAAERRGLRFLDIGGFVKEVTKANYKLTDFYSAYRRLWLESLLKDALAVHDKGQDVKVDLKILHDYLYNDPEARDASVDIYAKFDKHKRENDIAWGRPVKDDEQLEEQDEPAHKKLKTE